MMLNQILLMFHFRRCQRRRDAISLPRAPLLPLLLPLPVRRLHHQPQVHPHGRTLCQRRGGKTHAGRARGAERQVGVRLRHRQVRREDADPRHRGHHRPEQVQGLHPRLRHRPHPHVWPCAHHAQRPARLPPGGGGGRGQGGRGRGPRGWFGRKESHRGWVG